MISEEEKKAIEIIKYNDIARPLACGDITICNIEDLKTVLNLIEKQNKEIECLKNLNKHQSKDITKAVDYTFELNKELEEKETLYQKALSELVIADKMIDEIKLELREHLGFENRLKKENRKPDEFNQGCFYAAQNIKDIIDRRRLKNDSRTN